MINATQMAKIFDKRISFFLKTEHTKDFIEAVLLSPYGDNKTGITEKSQLIKITNKATWMHRILALKFTAWLNPFFEVWVYSTIDSILLGHFADIKQATIDKIRIQQEKESFEKMMTYFCNQNNLS